MKKIIYKVYWAWSFEKEEKWLNEMSAKGLALVGVDFCKYAFEECVPGEFKIRLKVLNNVPTHAQSQQYIKFVEETGAEYLGSIMRWVYFRKKTVDGEFELYSDNASRINHLNRVLTLIGVFALLNICFGLNNISGPLHSGADTGLIVGALSLSLGLFLSYGFLRVYLKKLKLQKQQNLFE